MDEIKKKKKLCYDVLSMAMVLYPVLVFVSLREQ